MEAKFGERLETMEKNPGTRGGGGRLRRIGGRGGMGREGRVGRGV